MGMSEPNSPPDSGLPLADRRVVLGICGSIACYKAADIASKLTQAGATVDAVMTPAAARFITPLAIRSLTGRPVYVDMFDPETDVAEAHIALARRADAVLVAPASATTLARIAYGLAEDMVSLTVLATRAPVLFAPAMDNQMWSNAATAANVETLRTRGIAFVGPGTGRLASGHSGAGRLEETPVVLGALRALLGREGDLAGRRVVVTAGGTQEPLDPVRFISNHSSGKMGYALAEAARDRGATVTLIATPGTAALIASLGLPVRQVGKLSDGDRTITQLIQGGQVQLVVNTVTGGRPVLQDGFEIRRAAVESRIPCLTSLDTASALANSLTIADGQYEVLPLTEYTRHPK